jgi:uncharacterized protein YegL
MLKDFAKSELRPLPVILLLDTSGSMFGYKIDALNQAVSQMISGFVAHESTKAEIQVAVITFGEVALLHQELAPAHQLTDFSTLHATGLTPLGGALRIAKEMIESKDKISSRSYRPTVVLVSDGQPNDEFETLMHEFIHEGRTAKCDRWAMAIGEGADKQMLARFINDPQKKVWEASDAREIVNFFRLLTMSTTSRSKSADPNKLDEKFFGKQLKLEDLDDDDY